MYLGELFPFGPPLSDMPIPDVPGYTPSDFDNIAPGVVQAAQQISVPGEDWLSALARVLPMLALANNQRQLLNIQLERARNGQPPLDASNYGLGVNVGLSPDVQKMILFGLLGIGALLLLPRLMRR